MTDALTDRAPSGAADPAKPPRTGWWRRGFVPLLQRLHLLVGIFVGPFLVVAAVTGLLYALSPQLERMVYADQLTASRVTDRPVALSEQVRTAAALVPGGTVSEIRPAPEPGATTRVTFTVPDLPDGRARTVFVDPATGDSRGILTTYGEWLPLRTWLDDLHRHLQLGAVGRVYSELAASWLWVLTLSGLAAWLTRRRRRRRDAVLPRRGGSVRARRLSRHAVVGTWAALGFLMLSATGLTWSQFAGQNVQTLRAELSWNTPSVETETPAAASGSGSSSGRSASEPSAAEPAAVADTVLATARAQGLRNPLKVVPGEDGAAWKVSEAKRSWPSQQDSIAVDPTTGAVLDRIDFADWPLAAKLARWGIDAHMGLLFGVANQVVLVLLAVALIVLVVLGYRMWWSRGPRARLRAQEAAGTDVRPARAAFLVLVAIGAVTAVAMPVLGGSLLVFLLVDALVETRRRKVSPQAAP